MNTKHEKLKKFLADLANWRPPSFTQIMAHMGYKSKKSVSDALRKIKWERTLKENSRELQ